jgi:hypothetical protein
MKKTKRKLKNNNQVEQLCDIKNECFICLENYHNNEISIKLNENPYYQKKCDCNVWVHNFCLDKWYSASSYICPICREYIFTDLYQYHYPINEEEPINEEPVNEEVVNEEPLVNQNDTMLSKLIKICIFLLLLSSFLCLLLKQKETGLAY